MKIICKIFGHKWSELKYVDEGKCDELKICSRCNQIRNIPITHKWNEWKQLDSCKKKRECDRCPEIETIYSHKYDNWEFVQENYCLQNRKCLNEKCSIIEERNNHDWDSWQNSTRKCKRCPEKENCTHSSMTEYEVDEELEGFNPTTVTRVTYECCAECDYVGKELSRVTGVQIIC